LIKRTSLKNIESLLSKNPKWKILDIGCGYTANRFANTVADVQDLEKFYKSKKFIQIIDKKLPFKDNEFDFVISSHVIEHVKDITFFIGELERISKKGYIELPSRLGDNIVFENQNDHKWWFVYDDISQKLIYSKKSQILDPFLSVSSAKKIEKSFRECLILELYWENKIDIEYDDKLQNENNIKISFISLIRKYFSKILRMKIKR
tara:strand:+ start:114 stop:731 length:618 start_codon:yes stop_codon:yes gene_type:complete